MTYFDTSLSSAPVAERNLDPILPEERFIFELVGFERSGVDQWHKNGGIKWTFATYDIDGRPWEFQDEQYMLWRTTNVNKAGEPLFTIGTQAHEWAEALLGRKIGPDDHINVIELRNKRMSSQIVWETKRTKPGEKAAALRSLRHVPVNAPQPTSARPAPGQVTADATDEDIDRATVVTDIQKAIKSLKKLDATAGAQAQQAFLDSDDDANADALRVLLGSIKNAITTAMDA